MKSKQNCSAKVLRRRHEEELAALEIKFRGIFGGQERGKVRWKMNTKMNANTSPRVIGGGIAVRILNCANSSGENQSAFKAC